MILRLADPSDADELAAVGDLTVDAYEADGYLGGAEDGYADHLRAPRTGPATPSWPWPWTTTRDAAGHRDVLPRRHAVGRGVAAAARRSSGCWPSRPTARGRGVGAPLRVVPRPGTGGGCSAIVLSTLPVMHAAHRLYERLGFVRTPERDWYPAPGVHLITYRLEL